MGQMYMHTLWCYFIYVARKNDAIKNDTIKCIFPSGTLIINTVGAGLIRPDVTVFTAARFRADNPARKPFPAILKWHTSTIIAISLLTFFHLYDILKAEGK